MAGEPAGQGLTGTSRLAPPIAYLSDIVAFLRVPPAPGADPAHGFRVRGGFLDAIGAEHLQAGLTEAAIDLRQTETIEVIALGNGMPEGSRRRSGSSPIRRVVSCPGVSPDIGDGPGCHCAR